MKRIYRQIRLFIPGLAMLSATGLRAAAPADSSIKIPVVGNPAENFSYDQFNCARFGLSKPVFDLAIKGYKKMLNKGLLRNTRYLTVCDMSKSSRLKRMFVIDMNKQKVIYHLRVAHGQGSGGEFATKFSNEENSHQTSLGFYTTGSIYTGENGSSLQLNGHEYGINDQAANRAIVIHGSNYVDDEYFQSNNRIGRSWGCPAIATKKITPVTGAIKNGSCFFIYHPSSSYLRKSPYLN
jgi:hypothetical protein